MLIAFVHNRKAFLPALQGYIEFFSRHNIEISTCTPTELSLIKPDIEWHFMGLDRAPKTTAIRIHDYSSASTPPFVALKNKLKVQLNIKPDYRLFPNQYIYKSFGFSDNIPFGFRDVGIANCDLTVAADGPKEFDFIYVGEMRSRRLQRLIRCFTKGALSTKRILFLTKDYKQIAESLRKYPNIRFKGPVAPGEVKDYIRQSKFGINYIPDIPPFNQQTSTKLLEYAVNKTPIITTRYAWIENFQHQYGGEYFYLNRDLSNFTWEAVNQSQYSFPELSEWTWEHQINKSGILKFLSSKFPEIRW